MRPPLRRAAAALAATLCLAASACVHEVVKPMREVTYVTTRSGDDVTLTWVAQRGIYYNVMYADTRGPAGRWTAHPRGLNLRAARDGEQMSITDRLPPGEERYYRLLQDTKPLVPRAAR